MTIQPFDACVVLTGEDAEQFLKQVHDTQPPAPPPEGDLLLGANAIAKFLGITPRQVYRLVYGDQFPSFKAGGTVSARKSTLLRWIGEQETK